MKIPFSTSSLKAIFQTDKISAFIKGGAWKNFFSKEYWAEAFSFKSHGRIDLHGIFAVVFLALVIVGAFALARNFRGWTTQLIIVTVLASLHFLIFVAAHKIGCDSRKFWKDAVLLTLFLFGVCALIMVTLGGWGRFLEVAFAIGAYATPVFLLNKETRNGFYLDCLRQSWHVLGTAFNGNSVEDLATSMLCAVVGLMLLLFISLAAGSVFMTVYYFAGMAGLVSGFANAGNIVSSISENVGAKPAMPPPSSPDVVTID